MSTTKRNMIATPVAALAVAASIAACGSGSSATASASPSSSSAAAATPSASATASSGTATAGVSGQATAEARTLGKRTQSVMDQIATYVGQLGYGNRATTRTARAKLVQLQSKANALAASAKGSLPANSPAQRVITQADRAAARADASLRAMKVTPATKAIYAAAQTTLRNVGSEVANVSAHPSSASTTQIANELKSLTHQISGA